MKVLGIDIAKNVFQLHGVDAIGKAVLKKRLSRNQLTLFISNLPQCCIVMEACGGANYPQIRMNKIDCGTASISQSSMTLEFCQPTRTGYFRGIWQLMPSYSK